MEKMQVKKILNEICFFWEEYGNTEDYFECALGELNFFCRQIFFFNLSYLTIRRLKPTDQLDLENPKFQNSEIQYLFILLCATKSKEILDLLNFILLPTDNFSFNSERLDQEIQALRIKYY